LQEICKSILALLALSAPFRICKLQILLAARETDPVSGHHFQSLANPSVRVFISNSFQLVHKDSPRIERLNPIESSRFSRKDFYGSPFLDYPAALHLRASKGRYAPQKR
jgi:hypothetical protein